MDQGSFRLHGFQRICYKRKRFIFDLDQLQGFFGRIFIDGGYGRNLISVKAGLVRGKDGPVFRAGSEFDARGIGISDDRFDTG